jgi:formylglycine-generating enzyme required for sulfatase activity
VFSLRGAGRLRMFALLVGCSALVVGVVGCPPDGGDDAAQVSTPTFEPNGGTFTGSADVTISCETEGATIRYTTDGRAPSASSSEYTGAIHLTATTTVKARGFKEGMRDSDVGEATWVITSNEPVAPEVSSFGINNGAAESDSTSVTLNNACTGDPTHYMASESSDFSGASWQTYATAPTFTLSAGNGTKTLYFKVKNAAGESVVKSDTITLAEPDEPPVLSVDPLSLDFATDKTELTFKITNSGGGTLAWTVKENPQTSWMGAESGSSDTSGDGEFSGTGGATITVIVGRTVLAADVYESEILVTAGTQSKTVSVRMEVGAGPNPETLTVDLGGGVTMELVLVPAGTFTMGTNDTDYSRLEHSRPVHTVTISQAFYMGKTEVTQAQWHAVMGTSPSDFTGDKRPVEQVSWNDCQTFCTTLSASAGRTIRLPSEAEWEYACRAGSTTRYCFGDDVGQFGDYAWYYSNSGSQTHDVGGKLPNAWGLYDMHGNVWEWCQDLWHEDYTGAPTDGSAWMTGGDSTGRVLRGGGWDTYDYNCQSAYRYRLRPDNRYNPYGFRVASGTP